MKKIKIAINGFGRIGRLVLRRACELENVEVVAINDPFVTPEYASYMFKYDTVHKTYEGKISYDENNLIIGSHKILFTSIMDLSEINWAKIGAEYICECSGKYTKMEEAEIHLKQGAKKVIISAPGKNGVPTFVMGVNEQKYNPTMNVISNASCTTNCLAPLAKIVDEKFGIEKGFMTTIHSYTATQPIVDGSSKKDWRGGRAGAQNIIPSSTGAAKAIGEVLPTLKGKLACVSVRVPTPDVSLVVLDVLLKQATTYEEICKEIAKRSKTDLKGIVAYSNEMVVSSDFVGDSHTCIFDEKAGIPLDERSYKLFAWYDNEWAYSCKLLDLILYISTK